MSAAHETLSRLVETESGALAQMTDEEASRPRAPGKWSRKQILGHLIDSALNNHQRFVRASIAGGLSFPGYQQDLWVQAQGHAGESWQELLSLWSHLNRMLARVVRQIPAERLSAECRIGDRAPVTLGWLIDDYLRHTKHHLAQISSADRTRTPATDHARYHDSIPLCSLRRHHVTPPPILPRIT